MTHAAHPTRKAIRLFALFCCVLYMLSGCAPASLVPPGQADALVVPQVQHLRHADALNAALNEQFSPLIDVLQSLRDNGISISIAYSLTEQPQRQTYQLDTTISAPGMEPLSLSAVLLHPAQASVDCVDAAQQALWGDAALWADLLVLRLAGMPVDFATCTQPLTVQDMAALLLAAYEKQAGQPVDDTGILADVSDPVLRKSYALSLLSYSEDNSAISTEPLASSDLFALMARYAHAVDRTLLGLASQTVSLQDALARVTPVVEAFAPASSDWLALPDAALPADAASFTRRQWAALLVQRYTYQFGLIPASSSTLALRDTAYSTDIQAVQAGLVAPYPVYPLFTPEQTVRYDQFPAFMQQAYNAFYDRALLLPTSSVSSPSSAWMRIDPQSDALPAPRALHLLAPLIAYYQQRTPLQQAPTVVRNLPDWEFYYSQYETGPYSLMNCMPTLTAMALKWQRQDCDVTPEQIRARYPGDGGWYLSQVTESLDHYGGRYEVMALAQDDPPAVIDALCTRLDQGCIILTQIHEGDPNETGHCILLYGYRQWGESTWFYAYDPGDDPVLNAYGVRPGKMRLLEAHYLQWIIQRFTHTSIVMLPQASSGRCPGALLNGALFVWPRASHTANAPVAA